MTTNAAGPDPGAIGAASAPSEDRLQNALDRAYRYLAMRDRTEHEMRAHLARGDVPAGVIDEALSMLAELDYLDDARFARRFTEDRRELDGWGAERIERRLAALGVERDFIRDALAQHPAEESELDRAMHLLRRRFPDPPADRRGRERALGVLVRKGYEPELALEALAAWARE